MSAWISAVVCGVSAAVVVLGVVGAWLALRATERQRDDWRAAAAELAACARVEAWPLVPDGNGLATIPMPSVFVVVVGSEDRVHEWSTRAARALHRYDTLIEPEDAR